MKSFAAKLKTGLLITLGMFLASFSSAFFLVPNKIVPGGISGVGTVLYHYAGLPIGMFVLAVNVVLIAVQARMMGFKSSGKTVVAIVGSSIILDLLTSVWKVKPLATDPMLACIYGGILAGVASACIFKAGATLGGTDILAQILLRFRHVPVGTTFLWSDLFVIILAGFVYGPNLALFALIKVYVTSATIDNFMEGFSVNRQVLIISSQAQVIAWGIIEELHRGVTFLKGTGAYSGDPTDVLLTAVRRRELGVLEEIIYRIDPRAFVIVTDARRVLGRGFENLESVIDKANIPVESPSEGADESSATLNRDSSTGKSLIQLPKDGR